MTTSAPLAGRVAVVVGGTRGAGRGIAVELGAAGATVVVAGRSTRAGRSSLGRPKTLEDTADLVTAAGGTGDPVRTDAERDDDVAALAEHVRREHGRLDVLVDDVWGGDPLTEWDTPFWRLDLGKVDRLWHQAVLTHVRTCRALVPLLVEQRRGLVVEVTDGVGVDYRGSLGYDLVKTAVNRLAFAMAEELRPHGVSSLAVSPGWMRTEFVLLGHKTDEARWREVPALARTESPRYLGRAVAALAADPQVHELSGRVHRVADLARKYGFTDVDGRLVEPFEIP
jgi:NAD(P)-dependent dehydrogenase (short-subunit alcohol dehydrogenase family)